jgi:predicted anti-sigma-YlaC factor YlaD
MNEDVSKMSCEAFQAQLPELIGSGENVAAHPHLKSCELCRALLADLETIAEAARQLFPIVEPPDDLWEHIESAIKNEEAVKGVNGPSISMHGNGLPELE